MKVFFISIITLLFISLSDILFCNEKRDFTERAPIYRSDFILGILTIFRILQIPLVVYLGIINWRALIIVLIISILGMRLFIDRFVERFVVIPIFSFHLTILEKKKKQKEVR